MLYQTGQDPQDSHVHMVEIDDMGNGISDTAGSYPHVHEVSGGVVQPYSYGEYKSSHPGKLKAVEGGSPQQSVTGPEDPRFNSSGGVAQESVRQAMSAVYEGQNPHDVAVRLLFG